MKIIINKLFRNTNATRIRIFPLDVRAARKSVPKRQDSRGRKRIRCWASWKARGEERKEIRREREGRAFTKRFFAPYFLTRTSNRKHVRYLTETRWRRAYIIGSAYTDDDIDSLRSMKLAGGDDWGRRWQCCDACVRLERVSRSCPALSSSLSLYLAASRPPFVCLCAK